MRPGSKAADPEQELRDRAVLETLYSTGIRASELIGMNRDDIDRQDRLIRITGKRPQGTGGARSDKRLWMRSMHI